MQQEPSAGFFSEAQRKRVGRSGRSHQSIIQVRKGGGKGGGRVREDIDLVVWDMLNVMSVGHLGRRPKAVGIRT